MNENNNPKAARFYITSPDWALLREQKYTLAKYRGDLQDQINVSCPESMALSWHCADRDNVEGLINLIDHIQDRAVEQGQLEEKVYGKPPPPPAPKSSLLLQRAKEKLWDGRSPRSKEQSHTSALSHICKALERVAFERTGVEAWSRLTTGEPAWQVVRGVQKRIDIFLEGHCDMEYYLRAEGLFPTYAPDGRPYNIHDFPRYARIVQQARLDLVDDLIAEYQAQGD